MCRGVYRCSVRVRNAMKKDFRKGPPITIPSAFTAHVPAWHPRIVIGCDYANESFRNYQRASGRKETEPDRVIAYTVRVLSRLRADRCFDVSTPDIESTWTKVRAIKRRND